jgi:hypothetical protein
MERKRLTLQEIQAIPYKTETTIIRNPANVEAEEQKDADELIPPHAKVLELGGRYGLAASAINNKLDDPTQHVVVEPDPTVQESLRENRESHFCHYRIFQGVISRKQLYFYQAGFCSYCTTTPSDDPIESLTLEELQHRFSMPTFTHLVADCEGGFLDFVEENEEFVQGLEAVYFEQDRKGPMSVNYDPIKEKLKAWGFLQKKNGFRQYWVNEKLAFQTPAQ